jgi:glycerol-3-phosphate acyltransferase PlsY
MQTVVCTVVAVVSAFMVTVYTLQSLAELLEGLLVASVFVQISAYDYVGSGHAVEVLVVAILLQSHASNVEREH